MRLKHLQLQGYKTFATKTEFLFPSGITAIVGPNGSGKSNIADAIRWVLGEQSYTTLRGKRTEDMIFAGSQSLPRAGMAEVVLTLDNSDGWLPVEFSEVTVSRRAFRDGQNEYRINSNRVRLRDVSELLSQSGLSRRTYTIIGQGVVDSVLSLRAQERRGLFEEAAGIALYHEKRADALRKLDSTHRNLERANDIIAEIEPRLNRLERQAERAREHEELSTKLKQLLRTWYGHRWGEAARALNQAQRIAHERSEQHEKRAQQLQAIIGEVDRLRQEQSTRRDQLGDWHPQSSILHTRAESVQRELAVLGERIHQLTAQRDEHVAGIATLDARLTAQRKRVAHAQADVNIAQQSQIEREKEAIATQTAFDSRTDERESLSKTLSGAWEQLAAIGSGIAERESRREVLAERFEALAEQTISNQAELARLDGELTSRSSEIAEVDTQLAQTADDLKHAEQVLKGLEQQRRDLAERQKQEQSDLHRLRETEARVAARFELLNQLRRDFAVYGEAARALLMAGSGPTTAVAGIKGVLAQMIEVPPGETPGLSLAVEAALGAHAGAVVVADWQTAADALRHLRSVGVAGRLVMLALEFASALQVAPPQGNPARTPPLSTLVHCVDELRPLVDRLLDRAYLVPDLRTAHATLASLPSGAFCVTIEGEVLRGSGVIEGGRPAEQINPLAQEKEWAELNARRIDFGAQREALEAVVSRTTAALEMSEEEFAKNAIVVDELRGKSIPWREVRAKAARRLDQTQQEIKWRSSEVASAEADQSVLLQRQDELTSEIADLVRAQGSGNAKIERTTSRLDTLPLRALSEGLAAAQMALAAARQTTQGKQSILRELTGGLDRLEQELETRHRRATELSNEAEVGRERAAQLTREEIQVSAGLAALLQQIEPAENALAALEKEQRQVETSERSERDRLTEFENHLTTTRLEVQRREDQLTQLRNRIEEDLGLVELELGPSMSGQTPLPLRPLVSKLPIVQQLPEGVEDEIRRLRGRLRRLGAINPNAPSEYRETRERHSFLQEQSSDLVEASDSLRHVIAEMDGLIEHAFRQTYDAVAAEFSTIFTTLFDGGRAKLGLSDPDDLTHTGVEIVAQPPGKRLQPLASLSGGERALTAVALIFAVLTVSPTPFCILDEVDAMLDEANVGRFRQLLESLADRTQIVIITHNRGTISAADTLYGISMGADSVSQAVSVRMDGEKIKKA